MRVKARVSRFSAEMLLNLQCMPNGKVEERSQGKRKEGDEDYSKDWEGD